MSPKPPRLPLLSTLLTFFGMLTQLGSAGCDRPVSLPAGLAWDDPPPATYIAQPRLGVTNNGSDTLAMVSVDSLDSPRLLGTVHVGNNPIELEGPHHLARSPDGQFIYFNLSNYVVNGGSGPHGAHGTGTVPGYLVKLDVRTGRPLAQARFELIADRALGLPLGEKIRLGKDTYTVVGLTRGSTVAHIARAAVESIAFQSAALLGAMAKDAATGGGTPVTELRVDGGACVNDLLMQFQADLLGIPVVRPQVTETTALGAAYLAGLATGVYRSLDDLSALWQAERRFHPTLPRARAQALMAEWDHAVRQACAP